MLAGELGAILEELGRELRIPNLGPDEHETCLIRLESGIRVQVELLKGGEYLLIASDLGELPPGRYRIDLFEAALKTNGNDEGGPGTLGFSTRTNHLLLFEKLFLQGLTGMKVADLIGPFSQKAKIWKEAIERGAIPQIGSSSSTSSGRGIFGLRP